MNLLKLFVAAVLSIGMALVVAPGAQAQEVDCSAHVLDATAAGGISTDQIARQIGMLQEVYPDADVYVQAYEQVPSGSTSAFVSTALEQCANWRGVSDDRIRDNMMVVVYGHDVDSLTVHYGYHFDSVVSAREHEYMMKAVSASLGPDKSQGNPNYVTSALKDVLRTTESHVAGYNKDLAKHFGKEVRVYNPAAYVNPNDAAEKFNPVKFAGLIAAVIAGFFVLSLVFKALGWVFVRLFGAT